MRIFFNEFSNLKEYLLNEDFEEIVKNEEPKDYNDMDPQELAKNIEEKIERISKEKKNIEL